MGTLTLLMSLVFVLGQADVLLGDQCSPVVDNCAAEHAICGPSSPVDCLQNINTCFCQQKYRKENGSCVDSSSGSFGGSGNPNLGDPCDDSVICSDGNSHCAVSPDGCTKTCQCNAGYVPNGDVCYVPLGELCSAVVDNCAADHAKCGPANPVDCLQNINTCFCPRKYREENRNCVDSGSGDPNLGEPCDDSVTCSDGNSHCAVSPDGCTKTCQCNAGYVPNGDVCYVPLGELCSAVVDNCAADHAKCGPANPVDCLQNINTCFCPRKYREENRNCVDSGSGDPNLGDPCDDSVTCSDGNSHCAVSPDGCTKTCQCNAGYVPNGDVCYVPLGDLCSPGVDNCAADHAKCGPANPVDCLQNINTCFCPRKYREENRNCVDSGSGDPNLGDPCDDSVTCSDVNSHCAVGPDGCTKTCQCNAGYVQNGDRCAIKEGYECNNSEECVENAKCRVEPKKKGKWGKKGAGKKRTKGTGKWLRNLRRCRCKGGYTAKDGECEPRNQESCSRSSGSQRRSRRSRRNRG